MKEPKVRYAVVGLGWFAQEAILPAFARAKNSELVALVSGDAEKLEELGERYEVERRVKYEEYDALVESRAVDAVYIALPNSKHADYAIRAARAGVHVLCEKPMAVSEEDCRRMIDACAEADVRLMVAYRLHFEKANLTALEAVKEGKIGEPRLFSSVFSMDLTDDDNSRLENELGGGPLYDIGIYCINAARKLYAAEPIEVTAFTGTGIDERFAEVEQQIGAVLRFPEDRLAIFAASFGVSKVSRYEIVGTKGRIVADPAYSHDATLGLEVIDENLKSSKRKFKRRDQIAPELLHFSDCVRTGKEPEPSGAEGLADVRVIEALHRSAEAGASISLEPIATDDKEPDLSQEEHVRPHGKPRLVNAQAPH